MTKVYLHRGELIEHTNEGETRVWPAGEREGEYLLVEDFGTNELGRYAYGTMIIPTDQGD